MFWPFHKEKVHEPLAVAALVGASASLHVAWVLNLLRVRSHDISHLMNLWPRVGPIVGLYVAVAVVFLAGFGATALWLHGKDCRHMRDRVFWFYLVSIGVFFVMTLPIVYLVEIH